MAMVVAAGAIATHADAATSVVWPDSDPGISQEPFQGAQRRHKARRHPDSKSQNAARESVKPQGPLIVTISIERQSLKVYDANGFFAETPISTGMRGHPTPLGVFSIIQKQKFHRSNIYSGAPMPFMQRITWSGVAMHAGVLPGYPASHGCIRMPMNFAVKMWSWTRMGGRVVVTPGELTPGSFSHPLLAMQKPLPVAVAEPQAPNETKSDKAAAANAMMMAPVKSETPPIMREQTADASDTVPRPGAAATMSDAASSASAPEVDRGGSVSGITPKPQSAEGAAKSPDVASSQGRPIEDQTIAGKPAEASPAAVPEIKVEPAKAADGNVDSAKRSEKPNAAAPVPDARKDQARPLDTAKETAAKAEPVVAPKRNGQIAIFISRKDNKLYVRQNFAPLFEAPVTIAASERPLGTHVFTAQADKEDPKIFHWSVVTLPSARHARDDDERASRRRKSVGAIETRSVPSPDSPAEALDRIAIPDDVMVRIADAMSTGGSIIVSDQGIAAGETGEGTDFIVSLR
jgi:lipoprotein-anchoring transpeptidase ErfK/SrfK